MQEELPQNNLENKQEGGVVRTTEYVQASGVHSWVRRTFQALIILGIIAFLYKYFTSYSCEEIAPDFKIDPDTLYVNETVTFSSLSKHMKFNAWNFGDDSTDYNKPVVNHSYAREGEYLVNLRVNDKCEVTKRVRVLPDRQEVRFTCPRIVAVGQVVKYYDQTEYSTHSQWDFGDKTSGTGKQATHVYSIEGVKIIRLTVNKDFRKTATTTITVVPRELSPKKVPAPYVPKQVVAPEAPPESLQIGLIPLSPPLKVAPSESKNVEVDKIQVEEFLMQVAENQKKAEDFINYSCGNLNFGVRANLNRLGFREFCARIANKRLKIKYLEVQRDQHGCIIYFKVDYKASRLKRVPKKGDIQEPKAPPMKF